MATIAYADVLKHTPLPIDAQDIVSRVRIVVAGSRAGKEPSSYRSAYAAASGGGEQAVTYLQLPWVHEYADASDATYRCTRSFALPDGVEAWLDPTDSGIPEPTLATGVTNPGSPSAIRDGDAGTYAQNTGSGLVQLEYSLSGYGYALGFYLRYEASFAGGGPIAFFAGPGGVMLTQLNSGFPRFLTQGSYDCVPTSSPVEMYAVLPWDARGLSENGGSGIGSLTTTITLLFDAGSFASAGDLKVYEFYPLMLDTTLLNGIAKQNIKLPASTPQRVTINGYVAPDKSHTITGWPGGDYTGAVAKQTYGGGETIIDFEQKGSPAGITQEQAQASSYNAQAQRARIAAANYPVRLGERQ